MKEKILQLISKGKSYRQIEKLLGCSRGIISYHCKKSGITSDKIKLSPSSETIIEIREFYKTHTAKETSIKFNWSVPTIKKYVDKKRVLLTDEQKRVKNYERIKSRRQKLKMMAVEYMGGKCKCGYNKCIWSMEFHHKDKKHKTFTISTYSYLSWSKIKKELDKCYMLCSNCHREKHYEEYMERLKIKLEKQGLSLNEFIKNTQVA